MKTTPTQTSSCFLRLLGLCLLAGTMASEAQTIYTKANNADALSLSSSWVEGVVPGSGDIGKWDSTVTAANPTSWTPVATNHVGADGRSTNNVQIVPGEPKQFFRLAIP